MGIYNKADMIKYIFIIAFLILSFNAYGAVNIETRLDYCINGHNCWLNDLIVENLTVNNMVTINQTDLNITGDLNISGCVNFPDGSELCGDHNNLGQTNFTGYLGLLSSDLRFWNIVTGYTNGDGSVISLGGDGRSLEISNYEDSDVTILVNAYQVAEFSEDDVYITADISSTESIDILGGFELGSITGPGRCINFVSTGDDGVMCWNDVGDYFNFTEAINVSGNIYGNEMCIYGDCISTWDEFYNHKYGANDWLYNDSNTIYFNE